MGCGIRDKLKDFLFNLTACPDIAPVVPSGSIESPKVQRVEATRARVS